MSDDEVFSQNKLFLHGDKLYDYLSKGNSKAPVTMELDLTDLCNNACPGCVGNKEKGAVMDTRFAFNVIDQLDAAGVRGLILTGGGEPLLHDSLVDVVRYAKVNKLDVGLITSGQGKAHDGRLEELVKDLSWVRVSLDAGSPARYLSTHGLKPNAFLRANYFVSQLAAAKAATGSDCTVGVGYLTGQGLVDSERSDYEHAALTSAMNGADYFQLRPFHNSKRVCEFSSEFVDALKVKYDMKLLTSAHKYDLMDGELFGERDYSYCHGAHLASVITADGGLYACCHLRNRAKGYIGSLHEETLESLWQNKLPAVIQGIDVKGCVPYCRCDSINRKVEKVKEEYDSNGHKSFL